MPFLSMSQRRKFYALKAEGKMSQETIDEWESGTPKDLPERVKKAMWQDQIPGGKADHKTPPDFDPRELALGEHAEREHTKSKYLAEEIAMDHLVEDPRYYEHLKAMEDKYGREKRGSFRPLLLAHMFGNTEKFASIMAGSSEIPKALRDQGDSASIKYLVKKMKKENDEKPLEKVGVSVGWIEQRVNGGINSRFRKNFLRSQDPRSALKLENAQSQYAYTKMPKRLLDQASILDQPERSFRSLPQEARDDLREGARIMNRYTPKGDVGKPPGTLETFFRKFASPVMWGEEVPAHPTKKEKPGALLLRSKLREGGVSGNTEKFSSIMAGSTEVPKHILDQGALGLGGLGYGDKKIYDGVMR